MDENPFVEKANRAGKTAKIVTPQNSHLLNGKVGEAASNPDDSTPRKRK